jgi:ribosomal protein S27E
VYTLSFDVYTKSFDVKAKSGGRAQPFVIHSVIWKSGEELNHLSYTQLFDLKTEQEYTKKTTPMSSIFLYLHCHECDPGHPRSASQTHALTLSCHILLSPLSSHSHFFVLTRLSRKNFFKVCRYPHMPLIVQCLHCHSIMQVELITQHYSFCFKLL